MFMKWIREKNHTCPFRGRGFCVLMSKKLRLNCPFKTLIGASPRLPYSPRCGRLKTWGLRCDQAATKENPNALCLALCSDHRCNGNLSWQTPTSSSRRLFFQVSANASLPRLSRDQLNLWMPSFSPPRSCNTPCRGGCFCFWYIE